jgi:hypothetical protein
VDQISGTNPVASPAQASEESEPAGAASAHEPAGFRSRASARRRARYLRKARELGYRDLGGLVFNLHRFGERNDALVLAKLTTLGHIDTELRALEDVLHERQPVTVLREAGITACPRCAAIHSSEDGYCPNCGLSVGRNAELPIAAATPATTLGTQPPGAAQAPPAIPASSPVPAPAAVPAPSAAPTPDLAPTAAPAPAGASDEATAPATGSQAAIPPTPRAARSPAPPSNSAASASRARPPTSSGPVEEDGPTEILSPRVSDS